MFDLWSDEPEKLEGLTEQQDTVLTAQSIDG